ncbi:MAG: CIA30 family protein [Bacteroidota bacterium]
MKTFILSSYYFLLFFPLITTSNKYQTPNPLANNDELRFDFGKGKVGEDWFVMNDDVMGGRSKGKMALTENSLQFSGNISLENSGGYTFVQCPFRSLELGEATRVLIRYRSFQQTVGINFNTTTAWYKPYYKLLLEDTKGEWKVVELGLGEALEYSRGKPNGKKMSLDLVPEIKRLGFSNTDLKEGEFTFEVDYMVFK